VRVCVRACVCVCVRVCVCVCECVHVRERESMDEHGSPITTNLDFEVVQRRAKRRQEKKVKDIR
jgi:hypothetical protein